MRFTIVGTTIMLATRCSATSRRHSSASNRSGSTTVARSGVLIWSPASPQVWKSGAGMSIGCSMGSGIRDSSAAMVPKPLGSGRRAPFGVPLVPEVSTINRPGRVGR
ncbi:hypothetical protein NONI108955_07320 [Nocardia ninae]